MIIAALIIFGALLVAWLVAPPEPRPRHAEPQAGPVPAPAQEGLAEAA